MTSASSSKSLSQLLGEVCETTDDSVASGMLVILEKLEKEVLGWGIGYEVSVRFICPFLQRQVLQGVVPGDLAGDLTGDLTGDLISPILTILPLSHLVNPLGRAPLGILGVALLEFETGFETGSSHLWRMYPFGTQSLVGPASVSSRPRDPAVASGASAVSVGLACAGRGWPTLICSS